MMNNLKSLRSRSNLSLRQLSEYVDITHATLQLLETGKRKFNETHIVKLCYFFDVTTEYLLGYNNIGLGVFFDSSLDDEDHEIISIEELAEISKKYKITETILFKEKEFSMKIILPENEHTLYTGKASIYRSVEANKEDTNISKSIRSKILKELDKLSIYELEKVYKFINEYIK
ncbi:MAG: helix-turn-helix transcriptional regulator [Treponema sp.]|nr:helix-turn-helix transcriptional regulator [Treponema sp.]